MMSTVRSVSGSEPSRTVSRRVRWVIVQNSSSMVAALRSADMLFTATAALPMPPKMVMKKRAASMKMGLPGGWPTSSFAPCDMNSGQSQKLAVGSIVRR